VSTAFAAIGRFSVRFRWLIVVVWVAGTLLAVSGLPSLSSVTQENNASFLPASSPSTQAAKLGAPIGATTLTTIPVVAARSGTTLTAADGAALTRLQAQLRTVPSVAQVRDLGRSPDGEAAELEVIVRGLGGGGMDVKAAGVAGALRAKMSRIGAPAGLHIHLAGDVAGQADNQASSGVNAMMNASLLFIAILLLLIFRALLAPLLTLLPAALAVLVAQPLVAEWAHHGLKVAQIAQLLMIVLVLGAGTDYGLFLVFRTREEMRAGLTARDGVVRALTRVGESMTFSAGTVIAALLSLLAASFSFYSDLAVPLAVGIAVMLVAGLTLLPALLAIFGRAAFWPGKTGPGTGRESVWGKVSAGLVRRPAVTLVGGVVVFGALAVAASGYVAGGFGGKTTPPTGSDSAAGDALLARHFPRASANPTSLIFRLRTPVWEDTAPLVTGASMLASDHLFRQVAGPLDPAGTALTPAGFIAVHRQLGPAAALPGTPPPGSQVPPSLYEAYRATANYVSPDGRTIQFTAGLTAGDPQSTAALNSVPALRAGTAAVGRAIGATTWGVAGQAASDYDISSRANSDLGTVVPIAIVVIGLLLALVMRSLVAPLYLIASVALSFLAALGFSVVVFMRLRGDAGITFFLPFLMFIFLLALGEDYNILVMTRIREEARRYPLREAVVRALKATGTTVTSAGLALGGTFAVFAIVGSQSMGSDATNVGAGLAIGILMDTFLVRTLLIPSIVVLLGRWNWWPARLTPAAAGQPPAQVSAVPAANAAGGGASGIPPQVREGAGG
jgi:putative drug exporter of the RND superfamily